MVISFGYKMRIKPGSKYKPPLFADFPDFVPSVVEQFFREQRLLSLTVERQTQEEEYRELTIGKKDNLQQ